MFRIDVNTGWGLQRLTCEESKINSITKVLNEKGFTYSIYKNNKKVLTKY